MLTYDAVPRACSSTEEVGPFTLFVASTGWPYYARPRRGGSAVIDPGDVRRVLGRQREIGVPQALEWVDETTPGLVTTAESVGITVRACPLLVRDGAPRGWTGTARILDPDDPTDHADIAISGAAISVAFANAGTTTGPAGIAERDDELASSGGGVNDFVVEGVRAGRLRLAAVYDPNDVRLGPVGGGSYLPVDGVAEIAGVGVLPAYRRRGLAGQLTYALTTDALSSGVTRVFCSAQSADVAQVYEAVGFRRVGTACIAEVPAAS